MHLAALVSPLRSPSSAGEACSQPATCAYSRGKVAFLRLPGACPAWKCLNIISEGEIDLSRQSMGHLVAGLKSFYLSGRVPLSLSDQLSAVAGPHGPPVPCQRSLSDLLG